MKQTKIGLIIDSNKATDKEYKKFKKVSEKLGIELEVFNADEKIDLEEIRDRGMTCDIILNDDSEYISLELAKTLEVLGCKVIELSKTFYYTEDKWLQYLRCKEAGIPVPNTILLSTNLASAKKEILDFGQFPVVLKRVEGCRGEYVDKADNVDEAIEIIKKFWDKGEDRFPIIAQEFITSDSYRVLTIDKDVVQTAIKKRSNWKATGCHSEDYLKFEIDAKLNKILDNLSKENDIVFCGYDFAKKDDNWILIEINAVPSYKFFDEEYEDIIGKVLTHLKKVAHTHNSKA